MLNSFIYLYSISNNIKDRNKEINPDSFSKNIID